MKGQATPEMVQGLVQSASRLRRASGESLPDQIKERRTCLIIARIVADHLAGARASNDTK